MRTFIKIKWFVVLITALFGSGYSLIKPNIIFILADDMGYGDVKAFNPGPEGKTQTPELDKLAGSGMMFTNAHVPGSSCIISRYGLITGRYPFRAGSMPYSVRPLIDESQETIGGVLRQNGYRTGMVGKWHLGFNYDDYSNLTGGPMDRGFDYFYGLSRSLDQQDYYMITNRSAAPQNTWVNMPASDGYGRNGWQGPFWRSGEAAPGFSHADILNDWTDKAIDFINVEDDSPFFLYLAYASPHTPWLPSAEYQGTFDTGYKPMDDWGDWMLENDAAFGRVIQAVYDKGERDNTLIFFTSDNGPVWWDDNYPDDNIGNSGHYSTGVYRGAKFDPWEGAHRMPFIASWPGLIEAGSQTNQLIGTNDMLATFAALVGHDLPDNVAVDSYNIWPALLDKDLAEPVRGPYFELTSVNDPLVVIDGDWKLIDENNQLFNLKDDPGETTNLYGSNSAKVDELMALINKTQNDGYSVPRPRINTSTVIGCMDPAHPLYDADAVAEPAGLCAPAGVDWQPVADLKELVRFTSGGLQVLVPDIQAIKIRDMKGRVLQTLDTPGKEFFSLTGLKHSGLVLLRVQFRDVTLNQTVPLML